MTSNYQPRTFGPTNRDSVANYLYLSIDLYLQTFGLLALRSLRGLFLDLKVYESTTPIRMEEYFFQKMS